MPLVKVYTARDAPEAHFLRQLLESQGIAATVVGEMLGQALGELPLTADSLPSVWVEADDADRAAMLTADFDRRSRTPPPARPNWICPTCGEAVEEQFTHCWSCQSPRQAEQEREAAPPDAALPVPALEADLPCLECDYNLRGLKVGGLCPECGAPILAALLEAVPLVSREELTETDRLRARPFEVAAARIGHPVAALLLVARAWLAGKERSPEGSGQVTAGQLCQAMREAALVEFGDADVARGTLRSWGIQSGAQVPPILHGMVRAGLLPAEAALPPDDFAERTVLPLPGRLRPSRGRLWWWGIAVMAISAILALVFGKLTFSW